MDRFSFLGGVHATFLDDLYQKYLASPDAVEPSWRAFFQGYDFARENYGEDVFSSNGHAVSQALNHQEISEEIRKEFKVLELIEDYRTRGHLFTQTNPVRARRTYSPTLDIANYGLSESDLDRKFQAAKEVGADESATLREIIGHLKRIYCQSIGVEYMYIRDPEKIQWIKEKLNVNDNQPRYTDEEKKLILTKLNEAVAFENFLNTKFVGQKRFSIEGAESLIPAVDIGYKKSRPLWSKRICNGHGPPWPPQCAFQHFRKNTKGYFQ